MSSIKLDFDGNNQRVLILRVRRNFIVGPNFTTAPREHLKVARVRLKAVAGSIQDSKF